MALDRSNGSVPRLLYAAIVLAAFPFTVLSAPSPNGLVEECNARAPQPSAPIYGVFEVTFATTLLGTAEFLPTVRDKVTIRASSEPGHACIAFPDPRNRLRDMTLHLPVRSGAGGNDDDRIESTFRGPSGDAYSISITAFPDEGNDGNQITGSYFRDGSLSGDSAGTWGGGK